LYIITLLSLNVLLNIIFLFKPDFSFNYLHAIDIIIFFLAIYAYHYFDNISNLKKAKINIDERILALETSIDGFWIVDIKGNIIYTNKSYCKISGYNREEILKMNISHIDAQETIEENKAHISRVIKNKHDRFITKHRHKSGRLIDVEISTTFSKFNNGRFFVYIRDITEKQKSLELIQKQYDKLFEISNLQSHQVRNPITNILGIIELIDLEKVNDVENKELILALKKTTHDFDYLIKRIVDVTYEAKSISTNNLHKEI